MVEIDKDVLEKVARALAVSDNCDELGFANRLAPWHLRRAKAAIRAYLAAAPAAPAAWQDISTAPRDMTFVVIHFDDGDSYVGRTSDGDYWTDTDGLDFAYGYAKPTHWMPLPPAPSEER